jgi:SRSO17 transposase
VLAGTGLSITKKRKSPPNKIHHESRGMGEAPTSSHDPFVALAERFMKFCADFSGFFQAARHDLSSKARCYTAGLVMKAPRKNMERMEEYVENYDYQAQQQFLSDSPWDHRPLVAKVAQEVDALLGGSDSMLLIDESGFAKKGNKSAGVARQWNGRLGKVDNCQVGVFAALSDGQRAALVDLRLFLPESWTSDPQRCAQAKIPKTECQERTKPQLAWEMIQKAVEQGLRFGWVGLDSLYGHTPWLLRAIEDEGLLFAADVHRDQRVYLDDPGPYRPRRTAKVGRKFTSLRSRCESVAIADLFAEASPSQWTRVVVREGTKGMIAVRACRRPVWLWDGQEKKARPWWAVCFIDSATGERKYFVSNAGSKVNLKTLIQKRASRFWIERSFQDAKTSMGMADYQVRGWLAWHHHMALVMLAMLFVLRERALHERDVELLSYQDVVELLDAYLPRADRSKEAVIANMHRRHAKRRAAIESARRKYRPGHPGAT